MENLSIHSAKVENFKKIVFCEFIAKGKNVTFKGMCGCGKSSLLEAITTALMGKKLLPEDPIFHGKESAKITLNIGNGEKVCYTVSVTIKPSTFTLTLNSYDERGNKSVITRAEEFFKKILYPKTLDLQSFFNLKDSEQLDQFYQIVPEVKERLDAIDEEYIAEQKKRQIIEQEGTVAKNELSRFPFTPGLPEKEEDAAEISAQIKLAEDYNKELDIIKKDIISTSDAYERIMATCNDLNLDIINLKKQLEAKEQRFNQEFEKRKIIQSELNDLNAKSISFVLKPTEDLNNKLSTLTATNKQIRDNAEHKRLSAIVEKKREEYSVGLQNMKKIEAKKVEVFTSVKMPIEGLIVRDGALMFPDPVTGEIVRINSLSTGQKYRVGAKINAAFIPEGGFNVMFVRDAKGMDKPNYEALVAAADEVGAQLIMHETAWEDTDEKGMQIIIED